MKENDSNKKKSNFLEHSSFEKDINTMENNFRIKSFDDFDFKFESENKSFEKENQNIFENKLEEAELDEINEVLNEINKAITFEINEDNINNYNINRNHSFIKQNPNNNNDNNKECEEILSILQKPLSNKNIRNRNKYDTPFKTLLKQKKISLEGKVFYSIPSEDANTDC